METCRACLSASKDLSQVDETFLSSYNSLTNLNVRPFDGFPECFCRTCMDTVHLFIKFREKCISSEKALREVDLTVKSSRPLDVECELDVLIKREDEGDSFHETCHYGLVDFEIKNEFKKEESVVVFENEAAQMAIGDSLKVKVVRRKRKCIGGGRPKRKSLSNTAKAKCEVNKSSDEYFCGLCDESFIVLDSLKEHLEGHHTDKSCGICFKEFENWPKLLTHRVFHSAKKYCHLCPRRFSSIFKMEEHYLTVHYEEKNHKKRRHKKFTCKICERRFADASRLKNHVCKDKSKLCPFTRHLNSHEDAKTFKCERCPASYKNRLSLKIHIDRHDNNPTHSCDYCGRKFYAKLPNRHQLNEHLRSHQPEKRYACDMCEYTAIYANVLANHKKRRHKKFTCKICERRFADASRLKNHVCKDKSKLCPFTRHLNSHEDAKTFKCERCPASYKNRLSLKIHIDRHDNNPTHSCDYCGRKFYAKSTLVKHRRVHTEVFG
ncbi:hypothetical protein MSG28_006288 [Choristoneura fumiferana]|uniref:Uncharacterized protein n=1 Tax=Choristoneura fumiferana TaxID=7141 RepID=A0ACC0JEC3_CHOFU|nr:hypothetical protein MSG28_006288 [Choristoneura fumiferana]